MDGSNDGSPDHAIEENEVAKMTAKPQDPSPEPGSQTATAVAAPAAVQMNADGDHPLAPLHPSIPSLPPINHQQPPALPNANDSEQPSPPAAPADPPAQKTRGRPRKTPSDLNLNSNSTADTSADKDSGASFPVDSSATAGAKENDEAVADPQVKRKRGRPPGSRNKKRVKTDISFSAGAAAASAATTGGPATTAATSTMSISPGVTGRQKRYELKFRNAAAKMDTSDFVRMVTLEFQRRGFGLAIKLEPLHSDNEKGAEGQKEGHQSDSRGADGKNHDGVQMGEERNRAENGDHGDGDDVHAVSEQEDEKDKEKERDNSNDNANISKGPGIGETTDNGTNDTATATTAATAIKLKPTKRRIAKYDPKNPIPPPFPFYPSTVRVTPQKDAKWNEMFQQLQTFYLRYGHVNIPPDNANLLAWVRRQKFLWNVMIRKKGSKNIASGATAATGPDGGLGGVSSTAGAAGGSSNNTTAPFITPSPLKPLNEDESSPDAVVKHNLSFDRICKLYSVGIGHRLKFYPPLAETGLLITPEGSAGKADKGKGGGSAGKGDKNDKSANGNSRKSKVNNTRKEDDSEDDENSINQEEGSRGPLLRIEQIVELLPEDNPHNIKGNEKWEMMLQRLREYKEAHGDTYVPRKNYEELSRWTFKNRQQCKRIMNGDFNTHLTKSRYLQLYELGFDLTGDEQKVKEKQRKNRERMLDRKWEEKYKELLDYYKEHGNCDVSRTRDGKEKYEKLAHWADTQRAKYKAKMKGKKSFLTDEQIKKLATIGFKFQLQDDFDTRFNQLLEYKREHGHTRVPVFYTGHNKLGRWAKRMRDGIRNNEPWLDEVRRARLIGIDFDIEARQVFDWGARKKKQQQEEEDDRKAKAAKDAAATMARMDLHVPRLEHNDHQRHQNQSPAQQQQQQEELHQSKYENQPQHQPPAQPHVTSHQQQQPPPTHHQPQHQHIIQLPHQPLNPVLASFTGMDADRAAAPYYPGYGHYPYHPYHSFPPS